MKLSIVSPVYRAEKIIPKLVERIEKSIQKITHDYEIILVEDYGPDNSWAEIQNIANVNQKVVGIQLSRNFGQHYAISAGLSCVTGDWVVVMDCDLQDQPEEIEKLYAEATKGYEVVFARRALRKDSFFKRLSSTLFYKAYNYLSGQKADKTIANFGIYKRAVINEYNKMHEVARSFPSLIHYLGYNTSAIDVEHAEREEGTSSYSFSKLVNLAFDSMISNSNKPLRLVVKLGFAISFVAFALAIYNIIAYIASINMVPGYTTTVFSIWFVGGLILFMLGIIGLYIAKIFNQVKQRPMYVISKAINLKQ